MNSRVYGSNDNKKFSKKNDTLTLLSFIDEPIKKMATHYAMPGRDYTT